MDTTAGLQSWQASTVAYSSFTGDPTMKKLLPLVLVIAAGAAMAYSGGMQTASLSSLAAKAPTGPTPMICWAIAA